MSSGPAGRPMIPDSVEQLVAGWARSDEDVARHAVIRAGQARVHALVRAIREAQAAGDLGRRALEEEVRNLLRELQVAAEDVRALVGGQRRSATGQHP